jgi:hypothetical protein
MHSQLQTCTYQPVSSKGCDIIPATLKHAAAASRRLRVRCLVKLVDQTL